MSSLERSVLVVERLPARYVLGSDIRTCLPFGRSWRKLRRPSLLKQFGELVGGSIRQTPVCRAPSEPRP